MKAKLVFVFVILSVYSCTNASKNRTHITTTDSLTGNSINSSTTICFQRVEGSANQDTSTLNLKIQGDNVSGEFNHIPYEKDSRKGTIKGKKSGDHIRALWTFMQEGMTDTLSMEFKLTDGRLLQKIFSVDSVTGRQFISDTSRFLILYKKINCR